MRENRVRSWVEVIGSVIKVIAEFNEKGEKNICRPTLRRVSRAAVRGRNVAGPRVYKKILQSSTKFVPHTVGKSGQTNHEAKSRRCGQFPMTVSTGELSENSRTSGRRGKTPWGKPVSAINTVRKSQASIALSPPVEKIPPLYRIWRRTSPAYSCSNTSSWPMSRLNPVLCLDAITRLGKWAPGGINYYYYYVQ